MKKTVVRKPAKKQVSATLPALILVVDRDLRVQELNNTAREHLGLELKNILQKHSGEAFQCAHHTDAPGGCGQGPFCKICPIREAVTLACREQRSVRRRTTAIMGPNGQTREVDLLVTATPLPFQGPDRVLLAMEDISALVALQSPIPVCVSCKRVRDDAHYWEQVSVYFQQHLDLELSGGACPECQQKFFGQLTRTAPLFR